MRKRRWLWLFPCLLIVVLLFLSRFGALGQVPLSGNILKNPGFEEESGALPASWMLEKKAVSKGAASLSGDRVHSGARSLVLRPNGENSGSGIASAPLGIGQGFAARSVLGKKLFVSGWLAADAPATAVLGVYALHRNGSVDFVELKSTSPEMRRFQDSLVVPDKSSVQFLIINCHADGQAGAAYFDDVYVGLQAPEKGAGTSTSSSNAAGSQPQLSAEITVNAAAELRTIPASVYGANIEWIWDGNGLWDARRSELDPTLVRLTRELAVGQIRFPGGIFADFYDWKKGIGPQSARTVTESMPGGTRSANTFGTDEALALSRAVQAPLFLTANIVTGTPQDAIEWVRYVRQQQAKTPPLTYVELGNEQYVKDGSPHSKAATMSPQQYAGKFREFARALRGAYPDLRLGAIADENYGSRIPHAYPTWTEEVLRAIGSEADFISVHNGYAPAVIDPGGRSVREIYAAMLAAPLLIQQSLVQTSAKIDSITRDPSGRIKLAVTEWGPFFHLVPSSPYVHHVKTLGSALYVASMLRTLVSTPKVEAAHFFKLNDQLFMGWIGKRDGEWTPTAPYFALQMFTRHFGQVLLESASRGPVYRSDSVGWVDGVSGVPYVEVVASRSQDGGKYYVLAINKNFDSDIPVTISLRNARISGGATVWTLSGTGIDANTGTQLFQAPGVQWARQAADEKNPRFHKGGPGEVTLTSATLPKITSEFRYVLPKLSVTSFEIGAR